MLCVGTRFSRRSASDLGDAERRNRSVPTQSVGTSLFNNQVLLRRLAIRAVIDLLGIGRDDFLRRTDHPHLAVVEPQHPIAQ
jgi:hypothetical protein